MCLSDLLMFCFGSLHPPPYKPGQPWRCVGALVCLVSWYFSHFSFFSSVFFSRLFPFFLFSFLSPEKVFSPLLMDLKARTILSDGSTSPPGLIVVIFSFLPSCVSYFWFPFVPCSFTEIEVHPKLSLGQPSTFPLRFPPPKPSHDLCAHPPHCMCPYVLVLGSIPRSFPHVLFSPLGNLWRTCLVCTKLFVTSLGAPSSFFQAVWIASFSNSGFFFSWFIFLCVSHICFLKTGIGLVGILPQLPGFANSFFHSFLLSLLYSVSLYALGFFVTFPIC